MSQPATLAEPSDSARQPHPASGKPLVILPTPLDTLRSLVSMVVVAIFVLTFVLQPFRIPSESMEHTLLVGDFLLVNRIVYGPRGPLSSVLHAREPQNGDIIVFRFPLDPTEFVVKRILGVPGDRIHMVNGVVYRNGVPLAEPYVAHEGNTRDPFRDNFPKGTYSDPGLDTRWWVTMHNSMRGDDILVPPGSYFVMGDNRNHSRDSRYWGFVPRANILGRPFLIYFSLRQPSTTDLPALPGDTLGHENNPETGILNFARWDRMFQIVR